MINKLENGIEKLENKEKNMNVYDIDILKRYNL